jgi:nicotinate phosphoribosyltransferase
MTTPGRTRTRPLRLSGIDAHLLARGHFSDAYFLNAARILESLGRSREARRGASPALRQNAPGLGAFRSADAEVEMQFFARRRPRHVAAGIGLALGLLRDGVRRREAAGHGPVRRPALRVMAIGDGDLASPGEPVLVVRGRYRDFAHLETPILGVLTRAGRVATNVYEALGAAGGKPILFFPARFDLPQTQEVDGYAYHLALAAHARSTGRTVAPFISTEAQGAIWGGTGTGTIPHAYILCHLGDTAEAMEAFCRHLPPSIQRVALVDTTNDCVGESVRTARRLFDEHLRHLKAGRAELARRFVLHGVRADTAADLRDRSVPPSRDPRQERGVTPILVRLIREALDRVPSALPVSGRWRRAAGPYFRSIRIIATGGFDVEKIRFFESRRAPVDIYGIGSWFLRGPANDYTADVVRVKIGSRYAIVAKTGRGPRPNPRLRPVSLR